jgi:hypothetical protein
MNTISIEKDIQLFGLKLPSFPNGIQEIFERLANMLTDGYKRDYFGISYLEDGKVTYFAMAAEKFEGEAQQDNFEKYLLPAGLYLMEEIQEWRSNTASINGVFIEMLKSQKQEQGQPCVEWYLTDTIMRCLIKSSSL